MKKVKANSRFVRLLAFMLIATVLLCIVGFSANGWQSMTNSDDNSDKAVLNNSGNVDVNNSINQSPSTENIQTPPVKYYDYLTGDEISESALLLKKAAFVMSSSSPIYGISGADLVIEFPTEGSDSRFLVYTECINTLGKIGSIAPTRDYISAMISSFGGILVANGNDSIRSSLSPESFFDLSKSSGYSYSEFNKYLYSNHDLIKAGLLNNEISTQNTSLPVLPYTISKDEAYIASGDISAEAVVLDFSDGCKAELKYSSDLGAYVYYKNSTAQNDLLNDKQLYYKNAFVLFADSVTYESEAGSELIMNTDSSGKGYYMRDGVAEEITWISSDTGSMRFFDKNGQALTVGSGNTYIGFLKSSQINTFELQK